MGNALQGNPTRADEKDQERKKKQYELGVCRIRREEENQSSETLGSGFVVKDLQIAQAFYSPYCLISSTKVFPDDCNIKSYYLDFKKLNKRNLETIGLEDIAIEINRNLYSGLVVIPISHSKRYNENASIFTYRPFKVGNKDQSPNQDWQCHFVDDGQPIFSVKQSKLRQLESTLNVVQYQLVEALDCYSTYNEVTRKGDRKPYGGAILLNDDDNEYVVVGAMTFTDDDRQDISPVFFRHSSGEEQNVPDPANADEVVNPNPSNEAARYEDTVLVQEGAISTVDAGTTDNETAQQPTPEANSNDHHLGHERHDQELNVIAAERTEATEATVTVAGATETVPLHLNETHAESLTGNHIQVEAENTVDTATGNETTQQPTPAANSYDQHHGEEQNVPDPPNDDEVVNPNPSNEAARYEDTLPGHEHHNQERNAAVAGRTGSPNFNQEAAVSAAAATPKESLQPGETNAESLTINPIQEGVENTVDVATGNETAQQPTPAANSNDHRLVTDQLISEVVTDNSLFLEKLSKYLDRESRVIKCWKHLAYVMGVPREERNQFDLYTEHSPTEDLFNYLSDVWNPDLKVIELKGKLKLIHRNDVIGDIEKGGFKEAMKVSDLVSGDPKFIKLLSLKLDMESSTGNWRSLAAEFGIRKQKIEQFGLRGSGPTGALFSYMRTAEGLHDLTMEQLRSHFLEMECRGLVNLLDKRNIQGSSLVKNVVVDGSELLSDIGEHLNKEIRAVNNWRNLAYRLNIPPETCSSFDTSKDKAKSPTKMMFQWLAEWKPDLNIGDLLKSIKAIDRFDVVEIVTKEAEAALEKLKKQCAFVDGSTEQHTANQALSDLQQMHKDAGQRSVKAFNFYPSLQKNAFDKGFRVSHNPGEGDCMFYALSEQLKFTKEIQHSAAELRQEIVQYLQQNPKLPDGTNLVNFIHKYPSWTSYLEEMAKDGTWGDHVILLAAANYFNTPIRIISSLSDHKDIIINHGADPLVLGHVHEEHYVSLLPLTGSSDEGVPRGNPQVLQRNGQDRQYGQELEGYQQQQQRQVDYQSQGYQQMQFCQVRDQELQQERGYLKPQDNQQCQPIVQQQHKQ